MDIEDLLTRLGTGDARALARALTLVENRAPEAPEILRRLSTRAGSGTIVGITGPPGVGKSTLADALARKARADGKTVAILAIDPTSPRTGGALLGDRARMDLDSSIFIRSMATRGHVGGLADAASEALLLLEAAGKDVILLETVGAGQDEVEVTAAADATLLVLAPGLGDEVQAAKSGIVEIADVLVVNKADREGADLLEKDLLAVAEDRPVRKTIATRAEGVDRGSDRRPPDRRRACGQGRAPSPALANGGQDPPRRDRSPQPRRGGEPLRGAYRAPEGSFVRAP